jgi:xylitol oxidase
MAQREGFQISTNSLHHADFPLFLVPELLLPPELYDNIKAVLHQEESMIKNRTNWAGNYTYRAANLHYPETVEQLQQLVSRADKLKALGSRHSFNPIADSPGDLVSLEHLKRVFVIDPESRTLTVDAGARYGQICKQLYQEGYALHNLASLPHISIAGACATATHGSGDNNGNLATAVSALELVTADGSLVRLSRDQHREKLPGAAVGLGALGIVTKLTLDLVPAFDMWQDVYENLPLNQLEEHFDGIMSSADSVSLFTDWQNERVNYVWLKHRVSDTPVIQLEPQFFGATPAPTRRHPIPGLSAEACTEQMGIIGPWYERLPHFRMDFTPSSGEELQSEYILPRAHAVAALRAVHSLRDRLSRLLQISEVRTIAADDLWMSPCYRRACVAIHFTWKKDWAGVRQLLPRIEGELAPLHARPHWGKISMMQAAQVQSLYPRLADFQNLLRTYDPQGKFRNEFLDTYIYTDQ